MNKTIDYKHVREKGSHCSELHCKLLLHCEPAGKSPQPGANPEGSGLARQHIVGANGKLEPAAQIRFPRH